MHDDVTEMHDNVIEMPRQCRLIASSPLNSFQSTTTAGTQKQPSYICISRCDKQVELIAMPTVTVHSGRVAVGPGQKIPPRGCAGSNCCHQRRSAGRQRASRYSHRLSCRANLCAPQGPKRLNRFRAQCVSDDALQQLDRLRQVQSGRLRPLSARDVVCRKAVQHGKDLAIFRLAVRWRC